MLIGKRFGISVGAIAALGLAGCGNSAPSSAEQARADAQDVADVKAANIPPLAQLELEPIVYEDIVADERMEGAGCSFYPEGEEDPFAILGDSIGFVKANQKVAQIAPDAGSPEGPFGTRLKYDGREFSLRIAIDEAAKEEGEGYWAAPATITIVDGYDRELENSEGRVACGG